MGIRAGVPPLATPPNTTVREPTSGSISSAGEFIRVAPSTPNAIARHVADIAPGLGLNPSELAVRHAGRFGRARGFAHGHRLTLVGSATDRRMRAVVAHELTHVRQAQNRERSGSIGDATASEAEAAAIADAVMHGRVRWIPRASLPSGRTARNGDAEGIAPAASQVDTSKLPEGVNFQVLADGSVLISHSWLLADPDKRVMPGNALVAPNRMAEILTELRLTRFPWIDSREIRRISGIIAVTGVDAARPSHRYQIALSVYTQIGPPPDVDILVARSGSGIAIVLRQATLAPGPIDSPREINMSPALRDNLLSAIERFTGLVAQPAVRNAVINGGQKMQVTASPATKGVYGTLSQRTMETLFGGAQWRRYLAKPPEARAGVVTGRTPDDRPVPRWLPRGRLEVAPALRQYVTGSSVQVSLTWDHTVDSQAGMVLLPGHCDYEWQVRRNGKIVDSEGAAWLFDNRTTDLKLTGDPGVFTISVVATSRHFLTPNQKFRARTVLKVVDEKTADKQAFDKVATAEEGPFDRGRRGELRLKPRQKPITASQELQSLAITEGAINQLLAEHSLTPGNHRILAAELARQRGALEQAEAETAGGSPYIVRGSFVSREDSTSIPLKVLLHFMDRGTVDGSGTYSVLLHDTTFGTVTQHPGFARGPVARDVNAQYTTIEIQALEDMADEFHEHNDYPDGTIHLAAQLMNSNHVWEATRDTANKRKTGKRILGGIALVGGIALLFVPGGGAVSAGIFAVTATAGVGAVALEIEDRMAKEGELKFDRRLALDVLQVVSVALPFGRLTRVLAEASALTKTGYLLTMTGVDIAQGFLITADVRDQLNLIEANTELAVWRATTQKEKQTILADRDRKVGQIIGGAMVNGGFILISIGGGIKPIAATLRNGTRVMVREPVTRLPDSGRASIESTLARGWFEHSNAKGERERAVLSSEERDFLRQELETSPRENDESGAGIRTELEKGPHGTGEAPSPVEKEPSTVDQPVAPSSGEGGLGQPAGDPRFAQLARRVEAMRDRLGDYGRRPGRAREARQLRSALDDVASRGNRDLTKDVLDNIDDALASERAPTRAEQVSIDMGEPSTRAAFEEAMYQPALEGSPEWTTYRDLVLDRYLRRGSLDVGSSTRSTDPAHVPKTYELRARFVAGMRDGSVLRRAAEITKSHLEWAVRSAGSESGAVAAGDAIWIDKLSGKMEAGPTGTTTLWPSDPVWGAWRVDHTVELQHGGLDHASNYVAVPQKLHDAKTSAMRKFGRMVLKLE
ncbi:hypothetical protein ACX80V_17035 [Arthrobacter sp. MDT3-24]